MAHSSELRWSDAAQEVGTIAAQTLSSLNTAEEIYQELFEAYTYAGGTDQAFADMLFQDINGIVEPTPITDTASAAQVSLVADLRVAIQALHTLYQGMNNVLIAQEDRAASLRRMS